MARLLIVDDTVALTELFAAAVSRGGGHQVRVLDSIDTLADTIDTVGDTDLALIDLSFPRDSRSGFDALAMIHLRHPQVRLGIITQGDRWVAEILRSAWEFLPITTVISKSAPLTDQFAAIESVLATGTAAVDPAIRLLLPSGPSGTRSPEDFAQLIQHRGHAKVWKSLLDLGSEEATYRAIAESTGLKLNTIKNYRAQLLEALENHGLPDASLRQMHAFARRCRVFLLPYLEAYDEVPDVAVSALAP
jgi:DNA-binding NarL/FixJ family response regulator